VKEWVSQVDKETQSLSQKYASRTDFCQRIHFPGLDISQNVTEKVTGS